MGRRGRTAAVILAVCVALLAYGYLLFWHASFAVGGSDSSGYANTARLIAGGRIVEPVDALKQLDLPDDQQSAPGDTVSLSVSGTDADNDALTYTAVGLPLGLTIDPVSGGITGTVDPTVARGTPYAVTVTA